MLTLIPIWQRLLVFASLVFVVHPSEGATPPAAQGKPDGQTPWVMPVENGHGIPKGKKEGEHFYYSDLFPVPYREAMERDLNRLDHLDFVDNDVRLTRIFFGWDARGIYQVRRYEHRDERFPAWSYSLFQSADLKRWLLDRIGWIVTCYDTSLPNVCPTRYDRSLNVSMQYYKDAYEALPQSKKNELARLSVEAFDRWIKQNIPAPEWPKQGGGKMKIEYGAKAIVRLGKRYFFAGQESLKDDERGSSEATRIMRLAYLFREARTADSLAYRKIMCADNHPRRGMECDVSHKGVYLVSALILKSLLSSCGTCNGVDRAIINAEIVRSLERVPSGSFLND